MPESYTVKITLVSNNRPCHAGHQLGQEWTFDYMTPPGMCSLAWNAMYPMVLALSTGGTFPWQEDPDTLTLSCPDQEVQNIFELKRGRRGQ